MIVIVNFHSMLLPSSTIDEIIANFTSISAMIIYAIYVLAFLFAFTHNVLKFYVIS